MVEYLQNLLATWFRSNRRDAPRYSDGVSVVVEVGARQHDGRLLDVSTSGACVASRAHLAIGSTFVVRTAWSNGCRHLSLMVRRIERRGDTWIYGAVPNPHYRVSRSLLETYVGRRRPRFRVFAA